MNLLLLEPAELDAEGRMRLSGRRAAHLREVLGIEPGSEVRTGLLDGAVGTAVVIGLAADGTVELRCDVDRGLEARPSDDTLLLAVPRPKVLARCLESATALGYGRIVLLRSWRVDKAHLSSQVLAAGRLREHLIAGLEQSGRTALPRVQVEALFKPFVEDRLDALLGAGTRIVAHPRAACDTAALPLVAGTTNLALAIGSERGFTDYEIDAFASRGFTPCRGSVGPHPLRVETALASLTGELLLRRRLRSTMVDRPS